MSFVKSVRTEMSFVKMDFQMARTAKKDHCSIFSPAETSLKTRQSAVPVEEKDECEVSLKRSLFNLLSCRNLSKDNGQRREKRRMNAKPL